MKNWTKLTKKYAGEWVALDDDEETVIGSARKLEDVRGLAQEKGYENPIVVRIPKKMLTYVGGF